MSALDQAFINAYQKGRPPRAAQPSDSTEPPVMRQAAAEVVSADGTRVSYDPAGERVPPPAMYRAATATLSEPHWGEATDPVLPLEPEAESRATKTAAALQATAEVAPLTEPVVQWRPAFEVERFAWPRVSEAMLQAAPEEFETFTQHLLDGAHRGRWLVLVTGIGAEVGCTSTLLTVAQQLRGAGCSMALVDANRQRPTLGRRLGIQPPATWPSVLEQGLPLEEVLIESLADSLSLAPLVEPAAERLERITTSGWRRWWQAMHEHFDLVLADLGALPDAAALGTIVTDPERTEVIVVQDVRRGSDDVWPRVRKQLEQLGARHWSVAQNFTVQY